VSARLASLSPRARLGLALAGVLVYALVLWLVVVSPKRAELASVNAEVAAAEAQLATSGAQRGTRAPASSGVGDVVRLAKAMPSSNDGASLMLELEQLAKRARVTLSEVAPDDPTLDDSGATAVPVSVTVTGTFREITRFLRDSRALVSFGGGRIRATGRVLNVTGVELAESSAGKFPLLDAKIAFDAYTYDSPIAPPTPPTPADTGTSSGATAAGAPS
jgi:Tfp pilus assembly protein PilO